MTSIAVKPSTMANRGLIIAGCDDGSVKILDISSRSEVDRLEYEPDRQGSNPVKQVALSDDGQYVCAGFTDGSLVRWNVGNNNERKILQRKRCKIQILLENKFVLLVDKWDQFAVSKNADFFITFSEGCESIIFIDVEPRERGVICLEGSHREGGGGIF